MTQGFHDRAVAGIELKAVQFVQPLVGRGEGEATFVHRDRHRRGGTARNQLHPQPGQPPERFVRDVVFLQQLCDVGNTISDFPGYPHHDRVSYPAILGLCAYRRTSRLHSDAHSRDRAEMFTGQGFDPPGPGSRPLGIATRAGLAL